MKQSRSVFIFLIIFTNIFIFSQSFFLSPACAALSCSVTTAAACTGGTNTIILRMSAASNAHAELPSQSTAAYATNVICCSGVAGLGNSCSGTNATVLKLSAVTNAQVEQNTQSNYANNACISDSTSGDSIAVAYQASNCTGYDTTLGSMSAITNAHVGDSSAYTTKICGTVSQLSIAFSNNDTSIGFGTLTTANARYATGDTLGSGSDSTAHTLSMTTNAASGYSLTYLGPTLTSGANMIAVGTALGTGGTAGTSQFAVSGTMATSESSTMATNYNHATPKWTYVAGATTALASASGIATADSVAMHYEANISALQTPGSYTTTITYIMTGNF